MLDEEYCELFEAPELLPQEESTSISSDQSSSLLNSADHDMVIGKDEKSEDLQDKKKVGRKIAEATKMFSQLRTKNGKPLKKEYVRCQAIRGMKKCIRHIEKGVIPNKGIHEFNIKDEERYRIWRQMETLVRQNMDVFEEVATTWEGPATDGKVVRKRERRDAPQFLSFNDDYCRHFYEPEAMRELHWLYMQLVYGSGPVDPALMCKKMTVRCCESKQHSGKCRNVWEEIRHYVTFTMIKQLDLTPFGVSRSSEMEIECEDSMSLDPDNFIAEALPLFENS